jgi:hypothetical protein
MKNDSLLSVQCSPIAQKKSFGYSTSSSSISSAAPANTLTITSWPEFTLLAHIDAIASKLESLSLLSLKILTLGLGKVNGKISNLIVAVLAAFFT